MPDQSDSVSLREYFETRFRDLDQRFDTIEAHRLELRDLLKETVDETRAALTEYKTQSNEWRGTLNDIVRDRPSKAELDAEVKRLELKLSLTAVRVEELSTASTLRQGARSEGVDINAMVFRVLGGAGVVAAIVFGIVLLVRG